MSLNDNWLRFEPDFIKGQDFTDTVFERSIYNSIEPVTLEKLKLKYGIGVKDFNLYK